ncbi:MAG TPA: AgmX/PglI C-terminal domain-containing protein [Polyangiaceae bacterium]
MNGPPSLKVQALRALLVGGICAGGGCAKPASFAAPSAATTPAVSRSQALAEPRATRAAPARPIAESTASAALATEISGATANAAESEPHPAPPIELSTEMPYKLYERVIPAGEVYAAGLEEELARWNLGGSGDPAHPANRVGFHPGTRVIVDLPHPPRRLPERTPRDRRSGKPRPVLSQESLLAQARKYGYWPFRLCFEEAASADRAVKGGATQMRVRIGANGRVQQTRVLQSELTDADVPPCLARRFERLRFTPAPARSFDTTFEIELYPGDAPLPRRQHPKQAPAALQENPGQLLPARIHTALQTEEQAIERCFADALARDEKLWGRLELRLELSAGGSCTQIAEHDSRFPDRAAVECVVDALRRVRFPEPAGGPLRFIQAWRVGHLQPIPEVNP